MWIGFLGLGVGKFTDCRTTWEQTDDCGHCIQFQGDETDLEYAGWLFKKLRDMVRANKIPHTRFGKRILFRRDALMAMLEQPGLEQRT